MLSRKAKRTQTTLLKKQKGHWICSVSSVRWLCCGAVFPFRLWAELTSFSFCFAEKLPSQGADLDNRRICPSLENFRFEAPDLENIFHASAAAFDGANEDEDDVDLGLDPDLLDDEGADAHSDGGFFDGNGDFPMEGGDYDVADGDVGADVAVVHRESDVASWTNVLGAPLFNDKVLKNWAGPEHWRLRPIKGVFHFKHEN